MHHLSFKKFELINWLAVKGKGEQSKKKKKNSFVNGVSMIAVLAMILFCLNKRQDIIQVRLISLFIYRTSSNKRQVSNKRLILKCGAC